LNAQNVCEYSYFCRIDIGIGHGLGCFSLMALAANCNLFGSVALIAPYPGHRRLK